VEAIPPGGNWRDLPDNFPSRRIQNIKKAYRQGGGSRSTYYGRLRWDRPAYTISTYFNRPGNGCYIHPDGGRLISLREAARLQTFPDSYRFSGPMRSRCAQVGNAVPPLLAYQIARVLPKGRSVQLFCGAGGLSLGFEKAGISTAVAVDFDRHALNTYEMNRKHRPPLTMLSDLSKEAEIEAVIAEAKCQLPEGPVVVAGGPPCQGFSTAGNCDPEDPRNHLVGSFLRIVGALKPMVVVMENVPAMLWRHRSVLTAILDQLRAWGFWPSFIIAHAEAYGVPQLRRRLILLASQRPEDVHWPAPTNSVIAPSYWRYQPFLSQDLPPPTTVADAISDLPYLCAQDSDGTVPYAAEPSTILQAWFRGLVSWSDIVPRSDRCIASSQLELDWRGSQ